LFFFAYILRKIPKAATSAIPITPYKLSTHPATGSSIVLITRINGYQILGVVGLKITDGWTHYRLWYLQTGLHQVLGDAFGVDVGVRVVA
jgi:hypothetical protein